MLTVDMLPDQTEADLRAAGGDDSGPSLEDQDEETQALLKKMEEESAKRKEQMRKVLDEGGTPEQRVNKIKYIERMRKQETDVDKRLDSATARIGSFAVTKKEWAPRNDLNCVECGEILAERHCSHCQHFFCASCYDKEHGRDAPNWKEMRTHHYHLVNQVKTEITDMFAWPEDRKIQPGLSSNDAHKLAVKMLNAEDDETMARLAESEKHFAKTFESKSKAGILGPVVPAAGRTAYSGPGIVKGVKGASFGDLELDCWLRDLLAPLPNKLCTIYTGALGSVANGLNCSTLQDLTTGECCPAIESEEKLLDVGFKPGHARKLFAKLQILREEQALIAAEKVEKEQVANDVIEVSTLGSTLTKAGPRGRRGVLLTSKLPSPPPTSGGMFGGMMGRSLPSVAVGEVSTSDSDSDSESISSGEGEVPPPVATAASSVG
jgi:hypothetical protein